MAAQSIALLPRSVVMAAETIALLPDGVVWKSQGNGLAERRARWFFALTERRSTRDHRRLIRVETSLTLRFGARRR
jgi:hypothetical protein